MNAIIANMKKGLRVKSDARKVYRVLQKHLDTMPVGYPSTPTGVELRLLEFMFTTDEARAALNLGWRPESFNEIHQRARLKGFSEDRFRELLEAMADKGCIFSAGSGEHRRYACHPFFYGMLDMQFHRMTPSFYLDARDYILQAYSIEYYNTKVRQMRVIPINAGLTPQLSVAAYDDVRQLIDQTQDRIALAKCLCKSAKDSLGKPCQVTDRRDVCLFLRDYHDLVVRNGWARTIPKQEAFEILDQNEKDGLVLMPLSLQEPQVVCSCCGCCCGVLEVVSMMPRTVDFVESNYRANLKPRACTGCGICRNRCQMHAIQFTDGKAASIDECKCIGCGLCVSTCASNALSLARKETTFVPPKDIVELYEVIDRHKKSTLGKYATLFKAMRGREV